MPKIPVRKPSDTRSRVDRLLDRFRNNRFAALVIVAALGVGALASFTDSVRKLADALPSWHEASVTGEWKTDAPATFYFFKGPEFIRLKLQDAAGGQVVGSIQFGGSAQAEARTAPIADGKRNGKAVSFVLATGNGLHESMSGELAGDTLRLVAHLEQRGDIALTAHRIAQSAQLVDGRTAIFYAHQEYPDHRAACTAMLAHLDPPQPYKLSEPPTEWGDVHCVGALPDGSTGFDQFENDVQLRLVCPADSRIALTDGTNRPKAAKGCECDGTRLAAGGKCAAPA